MTPAAFVAKREGDWAEFEKLLLQIETRKNTLQDVLRFARLYRAICTDLSLAAAFRLSRARQLQIEDLVTRGHNVLYALPSRGFQDAKNYLLRVIPKAVRSDVYVRIMVFAFYGALITCGALAFYSRTFAVQILGQAVLESYEDMHSGEHQMKMGDLFAASGFYIANNIGLNLLTFGLGILFGAGSLFFCLYNAVFLGTLIGALIRTPVRDNILSWVAGHAAFELTAIALAAAAGTRIGFSMVAPGSRNRMAALRDETLEAMPVLAAAAGMTFLAAFIEAFLGPLKLELYVKLIFGGCMYALMATYFLFAGRK